MDEIGKNDPYHRVVFDEPVVATIIEDRGNIGYQGRHLLRVRFQFPDAGEPFELEMPAEELKPVAA